MATSPVNPPPDLERPKTGGSYIRNADGSLTRVATPSGEPATKKGKE